MNKKKQIINGVNDKAMTYDRIKGITTIKKVSEVACKTGPGLGKKGRGLKTGRKLCHPLYKRQGNLA